MKRWLALIAIVTFAAHAQDDASVAAERARLKDAREKVEARYVADEKACYGKFAVNDCLAKARAKRREALGDLRRQEIALNDAERKRKAAERQRSIEERNAQQREREAADKSQGQSQQDRAIHANERAASRAAQAASAPQKAAEREKQVREKEAQLKASSQQREQDAAKAAKEHDKRVVEAKEHAEALKRRQAERTKPPASSLAEPK
jgi:colicin import membrane protein